MFRRTGRQIIAFLDDVTRFCHHAQVLPSKKAGVRAAGLKEALQGKAFLCGMWTDNGGEFEARGIRQVPATRRDPEQNGKVERFWPTIEQAESEDLIRDVLERCNETLHTGLPLVQKAPGQAHLIPREADATMQHCAPSIPPTRTVDGTSRPFPSKHPQT
jgi:transposase InsO family protein